MADGNPRGREHCLTIVFEPGHKNELKGKDSERSAVCFSSNVILIAILRFSAFTKVRMDARAFQIVRIGLVKQLAPPNFWELARTSKFLLTLPSLLTPSYHDVAKIPW